MSIGNFGLFLSRMKYRQYKMQMPGYIPDI